jgi:large subunit ribosomal protein L17
MRHRIAGRKLGRTTEHRVALLRNLSTALFDKERIRTTLAKAKELRPFAERLVTISKKETLHARRQVYRHIHDSKVVAKLFDNLSARYAQRPGGYTRIIKLGPRRGDNAEMAIIELVDSDVTGAAPEPSKKKTKRSKASAAAKTAKAAKTKTTKKTTKKTSAAKSKAAKTEKEPAKRSSSRKAKAPARKKATGRSKSGSRD